MHPLAACDSRIWSGRILVHVLALRGALRWPGAIHLLLLLEWLRRLLLWLWLPLQVTRRPQPTLPLLLLSHLLLHLLHLLLHLLSGVLLLLSLSKRQRGQWRFRRHW